MADNENTVKFLAETLLQEEVSKDEAGYSIGYPYLAILAKIKEAFPDCETTVKCLRWYAVHLNSEPDIKMPRRPRKKPVRS